MVMVCLGASFVMGLLSLVPACLYSKPVSLAASELCFWLCQKSHRTVYLMGEIAINQLVQFYQCCRANWTLCFSLFIWWECRLKEMESVCTNENEIHFSLVSSLITFLLPFLLAKQAKIQQQILKNNKFILWNSFSSLAERVFRLINEKGISQAYMTATVRRSDTEFT